MFRTFLSSFFLLLCTFSFAQTIDVQHYRFELEVTDTSDLIAGKAVITARFVSDASVLQLNLASIDGNGYGFHVSRVNEAGLPLTVLHKDDLLTIDLPNIARRGETHTYEVAYNGVPKDGLIISRNKYGDRTFFSDNWPNRAQQWIPCNDRPDDKASFEFVVTAPAHYKVISNGLLVDEQLLAGGLKQTHWKEETPLSTKIMAVGIGRFSVKTFENSSTKLPVSAWVYPQDSAKGFYDYGVAVNIVDYFSNYIAPFPFSKLANVQSKTIFGGMENASAIFYAEHTVTGTRSSEDLIAHEIAHQWFGDMASEKSFAHLWLSEGFATYLTDVYIEDKNGKDSANRRLRKQRQQVIAFSKKYKGAVVDTSAKLMDLLNANSYQKGGWILHMIRNTTGDKMFRDIVRTYYNTYKGSNADTKDFQTIVEQVTNRSWQPFFAQWLYQPCIPKLAVKWSAKGKVINIAVDQQTDTPFNVPLDILVTTKGGRKSLHKVQLTKRQTNIKLPLRNAPLSITLDPNTKLLFEASIVHL